MTEFASCWGILMGSMLIASPVIFFKIKNSTVVEEDLRFSDNTTADVMGATATHELGEMEKHQAADHTPTETLRESQDEPATRA